MERKWKFNWFFLQFDALFFSQDSLSAQSSSLGSSTPASVPASPGGISYNRSGSSSTTGPPISPLALTTFVNPRTNRSFMHNVRDQIKSHFHWPRQHPTSSTHTHMEESSTSTKTTGGGLAHPPPSTPNTGRKTPLFGRRTSCRTTERNISVEEDAEANRLEAVDSFPSEAPRVFPVVLVQPHGARDVLKRVSLSSATGKDESASSHPPRRFSLLEPHEEVDLPPIASPPALKVNNPFLVRFHIDYSICKLSFFVRIHLRKWIIFWPPLVYYSCRSALEWVRHESAREKIAKF